MFFSSQMMKYVSRSGFIENVQNMEASIVSEIVSALK